MNVLNAILVALLCCPLVAVGQPNTTKIVLVLYDGGREFTGIQLIDRGIESTLNSALSNRVTIFREYMDLTRIDASNFEDVLRDFYRAKYANNRPDVLLAIRGRPLKFLLKYRDELFSGVPIVSAAMDVRLLNTSQAAPDLTATTLKITYRPTVDLAMTLQPDTEHVAVVLGASPNDRALEALLRDEFHDRPGDVGVTYLSGLSLDALLDRQASSHLGR